MDKERKWIVNKQPDVFVHLFTYIHSIANFSRIIENTNSIRRYDFHKYCLGKLSTVIILKLFDLEHYFEWGEKHND